jgi:predicted ATP-grasp superfamily ATP-dependent carboligase
MRILVHEFVSGGGLAGQAVPRSLAREGSAMLSALVTDLAALGRHEIVATIDPRFPLMAPASVEIAELPPRGGRLLDKLITSADAVWPIAPETGGVLARLVTRVERSGRRVLASDAATIRLASDKRALPTILAAAGVHHPVTHALSARADYGRTGRALGYPLIVKPRHGAGCQGVHLARNLPELRRAVGLARRAHPSRSLLLQQYVHGTAASVSIVCGGGRSVPLAVNAQHVHVSDTCTYSGGRTPLDHPLAALAFEAALRTCRAFPGLRGYIGVDVVLTSSAAFVIEVNPRLTTAYLGVRSALDANIAELALAACGGALLKSPPRVLRKVRFSAAGALSIST